MRASGVVSLLLLTLVSALGVATVSRWRTGRVPRFVTLALHRNVSLLAVLFLAVHVVTAVIDSDASVRAVAIIAPLPSSRYGLWLGLAALALDLVLALVITSRLRHRSRRPSGGRCTGRPTSRGRSHCCTEPAWGRTPARAG
jgi:methionine sulfoxide reductase heme-binding subunit